MELKTNSALNPPLFSGVMTLLSANIATLDGGSSNEATVLKGERLGQIGLECRLPSIILVQSVSLVVCCGRILTNVLATGGRELAATISGISPVCSSTLHAARQTYLIYVILSGGASFRDLAAKSQARVPTCAVVFGSSTAGGAYTPGMSDCVIMVKVSSFHLVS